MRRGSLDDICLRFKVILLENGLEDYAVTVADDGLTGKWNWNGI
jgi:hypothetical protein